MMPHTWNPVHVFDPSSSSTLLSPGGPRPRDSAGTQHRIQKDYKPGWGRTINWLFLSSFVPHPSFSSALACFSSLFARPGSIFNFSLLIHNLWALLHTSVHLLGVAVWKPCFTVNSLWFMLIYVHNHHQLTPLLCLKLVNALKTVALLEVNVVDYRYKWVWRGWLYAMDSYQQCQNNGQMDSTPPVSTCPIHLLKIKQWTIFGQRE